MTPRYRYYTRKSKISQFKEAVDEMLISLDMGIVVRVTLFTTCSSNSEYMEQHAYTRSALQERFKDKMPAWSLAAQQPFDCIYCLEVCEIDDKGFDISYRDFGVEVSSLSYREIIIGGLSGDCIKESIEQQCNSVFEMIDGILKDNSTSADRIIRQWNYIENITYIEGDKQHYQLFNDARSKLYDRAVWTTGYPAATGIGVSSGGIVIDLNVIISSSTKMCGVDNPLQIAAHEYSQDVLVGDATCGFVNRSTPKFERAKVSESSDNLLLYISGTAAIRGENSLLIECATEQTIITMENINYLISTANQEKYGVEDPREVGFQALRVYIKNNEEFNQVFEYMNREYPNCDKLFLHCDVCRDELLVEIEGIATTH